MHDLFAIPRACVEAAFDFHFICGNVTCRVGSEGESSKRKTSGDAFLRNEARDTVPSIPICTCAACTFCSLYIYHMVITSECCRYNFLDRYNNSQKNELYNNCFSNIQLWPTMNFLFRPSPPHTFESCMPLSTVTTNINSIYHLSLSSHFWFQITLTLKFLASPLQV